MIDNFIPSINHRPCFSRSNGQELWVLLLEKAYAKLHNSYNKISYGLCYEAMRDLTGAPSYELKFSDHKDILDKILDFK